MVMEFVTNPDVPPTLEGITTLICHSNLKFFSAANSAVVNDVIEVKYQMDISGNIYLVNKGESIVNFDNTQQLILKLIEHYGIVLEKKKEYRGKIGIPFYDLSDYFTLSRPSMIEATKTRSQLKKILESMGLAVEEIRELMKSE